MRRCSLAGVPQAVSSSPARCASTVSSRPATVSHRPAALRVLLATGTQYHIISGRKQNRATAGRAVPPAGRTGASEGPSVVRNAHPHHTGPFPRPKASIPWYRSNGWATSAGHKGRRTGRQPATRGARRASRSLHLAALAAPRPPCSSPRPRPTPRAFAAPAGCSRYSGPSRPVLSSVKKAATFVLVGPEECRRPCKVAEGKLRIGRHIHLV